MASQSTSAAAALVGGGKRLLLSVGRRLLPRAVKRTLKRLWDPSANVTAVEAALLASRLPARREDPVRDAARYDVVCLSIFDWEFRTQRPQQLMSQFAAAGHRVFYVSPRTESSRRRTYAKRRVIANVWQIFVSSRREIDVLHHGVGETSAAFLAALEELRARETIVAARLIVQLPAWYEVAMEARRRFGWQVVYDCMDEWTAFRGIRKEMAAEESRLIDESDVIVVSSETLRRKWQSAGRADPVLIRNAADFEHFHPQRTNDLLADARHPVIGYFGAIAEWFDVELVRRCASARPDFTFVLIGGISDVDVRPLEALPNVRLPGHKPYALLPDYLSRFDVCIIPFVLDALTAATDPVKLYEYFSQGKPVVTTAMTELERHGKLVYPARTSEEFLAQLDSAVAERDPELAQRRIAFARENTWDVRCRELDRSID